MAVVFVLCKRGGKLSPGFSLQGLGPAAPRLCLYLNTHSPKPLGACRSGPHSRWHLCSLLRTLLVERSPHHRAMAPLRLHDGPPPRDKANVSVHTVPLATSETKQDQGGVGARDGAQRSPHTSGSLDRALPSLSHCWSHDECEQQGPCGPSHRKGTFQPTL